MWNIWWVPEQYWDICLLTSTLSFRFRVIWRLSLLNQIYHQNALQLFIIYSDWDYIFIILYYNYNFSSNYYPSTCQSSKILGTLDLPTLYGECECDWCLKWNNSFHFFLQKPRQTKNYNNCCLICSKATCFFFALKCLHKIVLL